MTNLATTFKTEIARLARKELKSELVPLRKALSTQRATIASLKQTVTKLESAMKSMRSQRAGAATKSEVTEPASERSLRFSAKGLSSHRKKLGLSREQYGTLVGVSGQSIYKWEREEARPRQAQLHALVAVRGMGKREAHAKLQSLPSHEE